MWSDPRTRCRAGWVVPGATSSPLQWLPAEGPGRLSQKRGARWIARCWAGRDRVPRADLESKTWVP